MNNIVELSQEITDILETIKATINKDTDYVWTHFNSIDELLTALNDYIARVKNSDHTVYSQLAFEFAPTSTFQELSISNRWGRDFLALAARFDAIYEKVKRFI